MLLVVQLTNRKFLSGKNNQAEAIKIESLGILHLRYHFKQKRMPAPQSDTEQVHNNVGDCFAAGKKKNE
jgi:hypothetical protein